MLWSWWCALALPTRLQPLSSATVGAKQKTTTIFNQKCVFSARSGCIMLCFFHFLVLFVFRRFSLFFFYFSPLCFLSLSILLLLFLSSFSFLSCLLCVPPAFFCGSSALFSLSLFLLLFSLLSCPLHLLSLLFVLFSAFLSPPLTPLSLFSYSHRPLPSSPFFSPCLSFLSILCALHPFHFYVSVCLFPFSILSCSFMLFFLFSFPVLPFLFFCFASHFSSLLFSSLVFSCLFSACLLLFSFLSRLSYFFSSRFSCLPFFSASLPFWHLDCLCSPLLLFSSFGPLL